MNSIIEQNKSTNVLLVTLAAQGHLNPLLRLGKRLVSKGLHVTLATNDYALKHRSPDVNSVGGILLEFFSDGLPIDYNRKADRDHYLNSLWKFGSVNLLALIRSHACKFACIVHTPFVPWVADVAAEFPTDSNPNITVKLSWLPVLGAEELPSFVLPSNTSRMLDNILKEVFQNMRKVKWVLGNSFMELEKDVIVSVNDTGHVFWPVGPIVPETLFGKKDDVSFDLFKSDGQSNCIEWLKKQKPHSVVYISFGTLVFLSHKDIESIAAGLKNTKRPFLWVIRPPENQEMPKLKILEEVKEQGLIVSWSPQTSVLSHPSVGCFLSHCGWNSLLESIATGVPVLACPQWTDQPTNAKLVTDVWGIEVRLKKNSEGGMCGDDVERCMEDIMSGPRSAEFKKNAEELKIEAHAAVSEDGSSDKSAQLKRNMIESELSNKQH
ncbi:UDP-glycosyltransferase 84B1-like protein [Tanacetum coccineum]